MGVSLDVASSIFPDGKADNVNVAVTSIRSAISKRETFVSIVMRGDEKVTLSVPTLPSDITSLGVRLSSPIGAVRRQAASVQTAASYASQGVTTQTNAIVRSLSSILPSLVDPSSGSESGQLAGPVQIAAQGTELAGTDARGLIEFAAVISLNLAVFNLLPVPGLDGWLLTLLAAQGVLRKPIPEKLKETAEQFAGLLLGVLAIRVCLSELSNTSVMSSDP